MMSAAECCVLNQGPAAWAFTDHARRLAQALNVDVSETARRFNYVLALDEGTDVTGSFIPERSVALATDKRLLAEVFQRHGVPTPRTVLIDDPAEVLRFVAGEGAGTEWCLKFP